MTALFIEYQSLLDSNKNKHNLVGKCFYWSKLLNGTPIEFSYNNLFTVTGIEDRVNYNGEKYTKVYYEYSHNGKVKSSKTLDYILAQCDPYIEGQFSN